MRNLFYLIMSMIVMSGGLTAKSVGHTRSKYKINVPQIYQRDNYSCATTSLAMVISYYKRGRVNKNTIWKSSGSSIEDVTKKCGNDMNGLKRAARAYGYKKYQFKSNMTVPELKKLIDAHIPVIVNIRNFFQKSFHAVVVTGYNAKGFYINDPAKGKYHISYKIFESHWYANLCSPSRKRYRRSAFILYK